MEMRTLVCACVCECSISNWSLASYFITLYRSMCFHSQRPCPHFLFIRFLLLRLLLTTIFVYIFLYRKKRNEYNVAVWHIGKQPLEHQPNTNTPNTNIDAFLWFSISFVHIIWMCMQMWDYVCGVRVVADCESEWEWPNEVSCWCTYAYKYNFVNNNHQIDATWSFCRKKNNNKRNKRNFLLVLFWAFAQCVK